MKTNLAAFLSGYLQKQALADGLRPKQAGRAEWYQGDVDAGGMPIAAPADRSKVDAALAAHGRTPQPLPSHTMPSMPQMQQPAPQVAPQAPTPAAQPAAQAAVPAPAPRAVATTPPAPGAVNVQDFKGYSKIRAQGLGLYHAMADQAYLSKPEQQALQQSMYALANEGYSDQDRQAAFDHIRKVYEMHNGQHWNQNWLPTAQTYSSWVENPYPQGQKGNPAPNVTPVSSYGPPVRR